MLQSIGQCFQPVRSEVRITQALVFLRIAAGAMMFYAGYAKLMDPGFADTLPQTLLLWAKNNPFPLYKTFLETVAVPNAFVLSDLITFSELGIGLAWMLGALVPYASLGAMALMVNYALAQQHTGSAAGSLDIIVVLVAATLMWANAGMVFGLESFIRGQSNTPAWKSKGKKSSGGGSNRKPAKKPARRPVARSSKIEEAFLKAARGQTKPEPKPKVSVIHNTLDDDDDDDDDDD